MSNESASHLAANVRRLREGRGLSQQQMAKLSGVPRPTWASLESGSANPTLAVLSKAASALQVSIEELIGPPRTACQFFPAAEAVIKKRGGFRSDRSGTWNIYWKMADGSGDAEQLTSSPNFQVPWSWSPDGRTLIFSEMNPVTGMDLWELSTGGDHKTEPLLVTPFMESLLSLSPDGRWLAYTSEESGNNQIYVRPYPLTEERHQVSVAPGSDQPIWSQNGDELFYKNGLRWMSSAITTEPEFRREEPEELFRGHYLDVHGHSYDVAPDGRFLLLQSEQPLTTTNLNVVLNWFEELKRLVPTN